MDADEINNLIATNTAQECLRISYKKLGAKAAQEIAKYNTVPCVNLSDNEIGSIGARGFAQNNAAATIVNLG